MNERQEEPSASVVAGSLDDYEAGGWVPRTVSPDDVAFPIGVTYSEQTGCYKKLGSPVNLVGRLVVSQGPIDSSAFQWFAARSSREN